MWPISSEEGVACQSLGSATLQGASLKLTRQHDLEGSAASCNSVWSGVSSLSMESPSTPASQMSAGICKHPIDSKTLTVLRFTFLCVKLLERDTTESVCSVELTNCDKFGLQKCVSTVELFIPGPVENPCWDCHHEKDQHCCNCWVLFGLC